MNHIADIHTGTQLNKSFLTEEGPYPVLNGGIRPSGRYHAYNTEPNTITISQGGASAGYVHFMQEPFWANAHCYVVTPNKTFITNRFLYHVLKNGQNQLMHAKKGAGIPGLSKDVVGKCKIPIPPIAEQKHIVSILDQWDALTTDISAGLPAEQTARRKQYAYYRNELLNFQNRGGVIQFIELGKICNVKAGGAVSKSKIQNNPGIYPVINSGRVPLGYINHYNTVNDPIGITSRGAGVGNIIWQKGTYYRGNLNYSATVLDTRNVLPRYLYHFLKANHKSIQKLSSFQGIPALNSTKLKKLKVSIPPISEQLRITSILDKFDTLVTNISSGLPAEIQSRKKQYQFYRDALLTFKEQSVA